MNKRLKSIVDLEKYPIYDLNFGSTFVSFPGLHALGDINQPHFINQAYKN